jgi:hypothetical protein
MQLSVCSCGLPLEIPDDTSPPSDLVHRLVQPRSRWNRGRAGVFDTQEHGHLLGDIPALAIVAVAVAVLTARGAAVEGQMLCAKTIFNTQN